MKAWQQFQALNKTVKRAVYSVVALIIYALIGFILLPIILRPVIVDNISEKLDRSASLQELKINPFTLSVTLNGFSVSGKHTEQLFGFDSLYVNYQAISLFNKIIAFDEINIVRPSIKIMLLASGEYNFEDLIVETVGDESKDSGDSWPLAIDKFRYVDGSVYFSDENRKTAFYSQLEEISVSLDDFSTKPGDGNVHHIKAETLRGTTIDWKGEFSLSPLQSNGRIEMLGDLIVVSDYMQDQMLIKIDSGKLDIKTSYDFMFSEEGSKFNVSNMLASITDLDVRRKENNNKVLGWESLNIDLKELDLFSKKLIFNELSTQGIFIGVDRDKETNIDFGDLFVLQNLAKDETTEKDETQPNWEIYLSHIVSEGSSVEIKDKSVKPEANHKVLIDLFDIKNLRPFTDEIAQLKLDLKINDNGIVNVEGNVKPASKLIELDLGVKSVELKYFQSYINDIARVKILSGEFGSGLKINIDASGDEPKLDVRGDIYVSSLNVRDKKLKEKFLSWKDVTVKNLNFKYPDKIVEIDAVNINASYLRLIMNGNGETNIQKLLISDELGNESQDKGKNKDAFHASIKKINIKNGKMDFSDNSLSPNFSAGIYSLKGDIKGLSTKQLSKAKVDLKGKVDKYAPVTIKGEINPLTQDKFTEIQMLFKGIELTTFTPYSGKFAGYKIEKGKLSLDLNYRLSKNELIAENRVILDQLTLGDETDSEDATSLPVNFALSLLKDSNGVIDFNLPIRGNIDDPDFHYGSLVWGALGNLIVGIVSSPFRALANLVGGDEEGLDYIVFAANSAELSEAEKTKLDLLAQALIQRPELHLEVRGVSSSLVDRDEMAYFKVLKKLKLKPVSLAVEQGENNQDEVVDYYERLTKKSADDLLPKEHKMTSLEKTKSIYDKSLIVVLNKTQVTQVEYHALAKARAEIIQTYLIEVGKVPVDNIFLLDSDTSLKNEFEDVENALLKLPLSLKAK